MVFLLNLIPLAIVLLGLYAIYRARKNRNRIFAAVVFTVAGLFLYTKLQPSYLPKGDIERSEIPAFTVPEDAKIEDRNRAPVPQMERRAQQEEQYRNGPVFLKDGGPK